MKRDLLIGSTSQLAHFWDEISDIDTVFMSSRDIDVEGIRSERWNRIYISFADTRTFLSKRDVFFDINVIWTLNLIDEIKDSCENIVYYSTTELWNKCVGPIEDYSTSFDYDERSFYIQSKKVIVEKLLGDSRYKNVIILFPFSFNSAIRKEKRFLLSKIFESIINETKVIVGNTNHYRDLLHPKFVVKQSLKANESKIIGSGRLTHVGDFIRRLYLYFGMNPDEYVITDKKENIDEDRGIFYLKTEKCLYTHEQLFRDTVMDIEKIKMEKWRKSS